MDGEQKSQQNKHGQASDANTTIDGVPPMGQTYVNSTTNDTIVFREFREQEETFREPARLLEDPGDAEKDYYEWQNGLAVIINNEKFLGRHPIRTGTNCDERTLTQALEKFNFTVKVVNDGTVREIKDALQTIGKETSYNYGCVVVAVMTHGDYGDKLLAYDGDYQKEDLWEMLNGMSCPHLLGKPKIVIIQACRGKKPSAPTPRLQTDSRMMTVSEITLPVEADILTSYSTYEGKVSYRDSQRGSWYIQTLCSEIIRHGDRLDFVNLLTRVNRRVAREEATNTRSGAIEKQMPVVQSTLTKLLYLAGTRPGLEEQTLMSTVQANSEKLDALLDITERRTAPSAASVKPGMRWSGLRCQTAEAINNPPPEGSVVLKVAKLLQRFLKDETVLPRLGPDVSDHGSLLLSHVYYWEYMEPGERCATYDALSRFITTHATAWRQYRDFDEFHLEDKNTKKAKRSSNLVRKDQPEKQQTTSKKLPMKKPLQK
ncbi:caspase-6-like [Bacillus rossius redtenbacheri]|uniref:caspase-6-like n=1 Tax=Bacillus rossius redtenbacheri TaxID=93214 RepID=UPI002FDEB5F4